jgi:hypothetical protein
LCKHRNKFVATASDTILYQIKQFLRLVEAYRLQMQDAEEVNADDE